MSRTIWASFGIMLLLSATSVPIIDVANGDGMTYFDQTYGGTNFDGARSVVQTVDGGYALAGNTYSWGSGASDFWLVKTDGSGNHVWNQTYGGTNNEHAYSIVQTVDGGYVLAGYTRASYESFPDFWLVKTDGSGNHVWNQTYGGLGADVAYSVVQTVDGGYALAGSTSSFGAGGGDFWLVKTDGSGNHVWNHTYGGTESDGAWSMVQTVDGGFILAGNTHPSWDSLTDYWLIKTDASGNHEWNQTYGGTESEHAYSVVQTVDGGYTVVGSTWSFGAGESDFWLVKVDASGNHLWNRTYGGTNSDDPFSLVKAVDGGYALAGCTYSFGAGRGDFWLVKTDGSGNHVWNQTYGGLLLDRARCVVQTVDGGYTLVGETYSLGAGEDDAWLVKTDEFGVIPEFPAWTLILLAVLILAVTSARTKFKLRSGHVPEKV